MEKELIIEMRQAIKLGELAKVTKLLTNNKGLIDAETPFGTFLHDATSYGKYEIAEYLINNKMDVNKKGGTRKSSAMATASFKGYIDIVKLLYDNGATLDTSTFEGNPLFAAIPNNHVDVAKFLIDKGIDLTASYAIGKIDNCDALEYARQYGATEIYNYLKEKMQK